MFLVIAFAMWVAFLRRGSARSRLALQIAVIVYLGIINHDMLSMALLVGWVQTRPPVHVAIGLVVLAAVSLLVPWIHRRQVYCHQLCPHGAAQELIGRAAARARGSRRFVSRRTARVLSVLPGALVLLVVIVAVAPLPVPLVSLEAFDAWTWPAAGVATLCIATVGLVASAFVPMAYCRFGCPTGAVLSFVWTRGRHDRFGRRDLFGLAVLLVAFAASIYVRLAMIRATTLSLGVALLLGACGDGDVRELRAEGSAMGTTWEVVVVRPPAGLSNEGLAAEVGAAIEEVEAAMSTWREDSWLARFNRSQAGSMRAPSLVGEVLLEAARVGRLSGGAFDISVGPLVDRWGFGPDGDRSEPDAESREVARRAVGSGKWSVLRDGEDFVVSKSDPAVRLDLSAIAKGYAIDRVAALLDRAGATDYLIELGGELRGRGGRRDHGWRIGLEEPRLDGVVRVVDSVELRDMAVATSGDYRLFRPPGPGDGSPRRTHVIDPRMGEPIRNGVAQVTVLATSAMSADAWATALMVLGPDEGLPIAEREGLAARLVLRRDGGLVAVSTRGFSSHGR